MQSITADEATAAIQLLADTALQREEELAQYEDDPVQDSSDDDNGSDSPILDSFYNTGGSTSILQMTNVDVKQFQIIWNMFADHIKSVYNVGRGRKSPFHPKDVVFMTLTVLKHGGQWDFLGRTFKIKWPTFERLVMGFVRLVSEAFYDKCVLETGMNLPVRWLIDKDTVFKHFKFARYASDVTFQHTNRPSRNLEEAKKYYSGKHKLYGYKVEVSVLPSGLAIGFTKHYPGSYSDIDIMHQNRAFHEMALLKCDNEEDIADLGMHTDAYPNHWAVFGDKGYQRALEFLRLIHTHKKPPRGYTFVGG